MSVRSQLKIILARNLLKSLIKLGNKFLLSYNLIGASIVCMFIDEKFFAFVAPATQYDKWENLSS